MHLSYVNIFATDIEALSQFYKDVFDFQEIPEIRSPIFVGLKTGLSCLGFNAPEAYALLKLDEFTNSTGARFLLNIDVDAPEDVDRLTPVAVAKGAKLIKAPYVTYYNWRQSVLLDPEGNVFRINKML